MVEPSKAVGKKPPFSTPTAVGGFDEAIKNNIKIEMYLIS
jgi:hypothetical protein